MVNGHMSQQSNLTWKTDPIEYTDTVHYEDDYVVHGRGFIVHDDIWFDEYDVYLSHTQLWNRLISDKYGHPEYTGSWSAFAEEQFDERPLYWSTTGADTFILQAPCVGLMTDENWNRLQQFLEDEFSFPTSGYLHFYEKPRDTNSHTQSVLQALKSSENKDDRLPDWTEKYKHANIVENDI